jgi:hypothetical protein
LEVPKIGLSSFSIPKELLPQLETEEDLEQILADAGEGDTTDGTTDDDESAISYTQYISRICWSTVILCNRNYYIVPTESSLNFRFVVLISFPA